MRAKKIFILHGHTDPATLSGAFADTYERAAREAGHGIPVHGVDDEQGPALGLRAEPTGDLLEPAPGTARQGDPHTLGGLGREVSGGQAPHEPGGAEQDNARICHVRHRTHQ